MRKKEFHLSVNTIYIFVECDVDVYNVVNRKT